MKKRLDWLDYGKGITILMVVIYHGFTYLIPKVSGFEMTLMDFISGFLFLFIMPLFFAFSGYLHNKVNDSIQYKTQIIKKVKGFLLPYILFSVLYVSLENLSGSNNVTNFRSFKSLIYIFTDPVAHTWFLMSLFLMTIIFGLFDLMKIKLRNQIIISAILTVIGVFVSPYIFDSLGRTLSYLLFFAFGEYIRYIDDKNNIKISNKNLALLIGALFFIFVIQYIWINKNIDQYISIFQGLIGITFFFMLYKKINLNTKLGRYFTKYGKYSLIIYLVHVPVIAVFKTIVVKLFSVNNFTTPLMFVLLVIIGWYSSVFIVYMCNKNSIVHFIFYPGKKLKKEG